MGGCHSSLKPLKKRAKSESTQSLNQDPTPKPDENHLKSEENPLKSEEKQEILTPIATKPDNVINETFEANPKKKKLFLQKSGLKLLENKEICVLELIFSYKDLFDFPILFRLEPELSKYQWELLSFKENHGSFLYKVIDKNTKERYMLEIIEFESENDPKIGEIAYQIFINERFSKILAILQEENEKIPRKKKESEFIEFLENPPILRIVDYYVYQELFLNSLKPRKWLHIVWEDWDVTLREILDIRIMEKKPYLEEELAYIGKNLLHSLNLMRKSKIAHRNFNPKNIFYVNSSKKYKLGGFLQAKLSNIHKINKEFLARNPLQRPGESLIEKHDFREVRKTKREDFLSKKFSMNTINDRNLIEFNKFEHSVIGTPYYMDPILKEAYEEKEETVRLLDGLFYSDLFAFAMTMFEVEKLTKAESAQEIYEESLNLRLPVYSLKAVLLKILNEKFKIKEEGNSKLKIEGFSPIKKLGMSPPLSAKFARIKKKKGFLQAGQILVETSKENATLCLREYQKSTKGNVLVLLGYLKKVMHMAADESDFLGRGRGEEEEGVEKEEILVEFYIEIGYFLFIFILKFSFFSQMLVFFKF